MTNTLGAMNRLKMLPFMRRGGTAPWFLPLITALAIVLAGRWGLPTSFAEALPTPPSQPSSGPGGSEDAHRSVRKSGSFGKGARAFYLYEPADPAPATAPVIVFLHGYLGVNPTAYGAWIEHLVRRGNVVVYPVYQDSVIGAEHYSDDALAAVREAFRVLSSEADHVRPDPEGRWALVGHSLGGVIAANLAAAAEEEKLPRPRALMACNSGDANAVFKNIPSILRTPEKVPDLLLLVVAGEDDRLARDTASRAIFDGCTGVQAANKNLIRLRSDRHGQPPLLADHFAPLAIDRSYDSGTSLRGGGQDRIREMNGPNATDALDFYGYWKWFDALTDAAFFGKNRESALDDTHEQKFLGRWSDGRAVIEPEVVLGK